ncbi:hypothetical protein ANN_16433 [Periplaneta americana]|uniref:Uncharacterized protein n=1 Tax=Periplaneta americana TaxID=6978 RepID=A0ABQ8SIY3_PERAM|nr:hypothetical protein ANN_16433 [Periplaneta americana]
MATYNLTPTPASTKFFDERRQKAAEIDPAFFRTPAMDNEQCKAANFELRPITQGEQSMVFTTAFVLEKVFTR